MKKQLLYWYRKYLPKRVQGFLLNKKPKFVRFLQHELNANNFDLLKQGHSEHAEIILLLKNISIKNKYYLDLGASDGVHSSSTYLFAKDDTWSGLSVEMDSDKFALMSYVYSGFKNAYLANNKITPDNVTAILDSFDVPKELTFLNLDIDSYDLFIIEELLKSEYRPKIISMEINEKIPPPVFFTVLFEPSHFWKGDHFFGCSITAASSTVKKFGYKLIKLQYNNAIFVCDSFSQNFEDLSPEKAYDEGYKYKPDRKQKFKYNESVDELLHMDSKNVIIFLNNLYKDYEGMYELHEDI